MWTVKHFKSVEAAREWAESRPVQWYWIYCNNKPASIEYRRLVSLGMPR